MKSLAILIALVMGMLLYRFHILALDKCEREVTERVDAYWNDVLLNQKAAHGRQIAALEHDLALREGEKQQALQQKARLEEKLFQVEAKELKARLALDTLRDSIAWLKQEHRQQLEGCQSRQDSMAKVIQAYLKTPRLVTGPGDQSHRKNSLRQGQLHARLPRLRLPPSVQLPACILGIVCVLTVLTAAAQGLYYQRRRWW